MSEYIYQTLFGAEPPPPAPSLFAKVFADPASVVPRTACEADIFVGDFLAELSLTAKEELTEGKVAAMAASITTLAIIGAVLLLGRLVGGDKWMLSVLYLLAGLSGAAGISLVLRSSTGSPLANTAFAAVGLEGELECAARLAVVLLVALTASSSAQRLVGLAFFAAGAALAGYPTLVAWRALEPIVAESLAPTAVPSYIAYVLAAAGGLFGGYGFGRVAPTLLDLSLAGLGAAMLSHAALSYYYANEDAFPQAKALRVREFASGWALALSLACLTVRGLLLRLVGGGSTSRSSAFSDPLIAT